MGRLRRRIKTSRQLGLHGETLFQSNMKYLRNVAIELCEGRQEVVLNSAEVIVDMIEMFKKLMGFDFKV